MDATDEIKFEATVQQEGKFTFVPIPFSPGEVWGRKPRFHVSGTIDGIAVRGTLGALGQAYFLRLGAAWLRDCRIEPGANVTVSLSLEGPQLHNLAADIKEALSANPQAAQFFAGLPTYYRKNYLRWIESAKRADTRARRIAEMVNLLAAEKRER